MKVLVRVLLGTTLLAGSPAAASAPAEELGAGPAAAAAEASGDDGACLAEPVRIERAHSHPPEAAELHLTRCDGTPNRAALDELSLLARPDGVDRPDDERLARFRRTAPPARRARVVAPGIVRLHPGLLPRLQALAERFPDRAIEIVSGYRPDARRTSRHRHGRALDLRIEGIHRREVSRFARDTLEETGVGFYPNSVFTHIDVRHREAYWVDRSGPGEPADYGPWPPSEKDTDETRERLLAQTEEALKRWASRDDHEPEPDETPAAEPAEGEPADQAEPAASAVAKAGTQPAPAKADEALEPSRPSESPRPAARSATAPAATGSTRATPSRPAASAVGPGPEPQLEECAVGGLRSASGVLAAWSQVPGDDDSDAGASDADEPAPTEAPRSSAETEAPLDPKSSAEHARRIRDEAFAALEDL